MTTFFQQLANGTILGATFGLIALGYTMVYGIIQLINFAHGEIFMVGAFGGLFMYSYILPDGIKDTAVISLPLVTLFAILVAVTIAVIMERFAYRPLRRAPRLAPLITAIGVSIFLQEAVRLFYPGARSSRPFPELISRQTVEIGGVGVPKVGIVLVFVTVLLMVGLQTFIRTSKTGKAMRATSQDPDTSRLMGINTDRIIVITFVIGAALAAVAGVMEGLLISQVGFRIGFLGGLKAFTAAVLGGIGNITGAMLGGFMIGLVEAMATQYLPGHGAWKDVWVFVVLIVVLVFRPSGLLGERVASRS